MRPAWSYHYYCCYPAPLCREASAETLTALATVVLAVIAFVAAIYAHNQLSTMRSTAQVERLLHLLSQFESEPLITTRGTVATSRDSQSEIPLSMYRLLDFFEIVGMLLRRNYLDETDVWDSFSRWVFNLCTDCERLLQNERQSDPNMYRNVAFLRAKMEKVEKRMKGLSVHPTAEDIQVFWSEEADVQPGFPIRKRKSRREAHTSKSIG